MAALADSHINLEESQRRTEDAQRRTEAALERLADAQAHSDRKLNELIDIVREGRER
jgi:hypothetical protein